MGPGGPSPTMARVAEHGIPASGGGVRGGQPGERREDAPLGEGPSTGPRKQMRRHASPEMGPSRRVPVAKASLEVPQSDEAAGLAQRIEELKRFAAGLQDITNEELRVMLSAALQPESPAPLDPRGRKSSTSAAVSKVGGRRKAPAGLRLPGDLGSEDREDSRELSAASSLASPHRELPPHLASPMLSSKTFSFSELGGDDEPPPSDGKLPAPGQSVPLEFGAGSSVMMGDVGGAAGFKARRTSMRLGSGFAPQKAGKVGGGGESGPSGGDAHASLSARRMSIAGAARAVGGVPVRKTRQATGPQGSAGGGSPDGGSGIEMQTLSSVAEQVETQDASLVQRGLASARAAGHFGRKLAVDTGAPSQEEGVLSPLRSTTIARGASGGGASPSASSSSQLGFAAAGPPTKLVQKGKRRRSSIMKGLTSAVKGALGKEAEGGGGASSSTVSTPNPLQSAGKAATADTAPGDAGRHSAASVVSKGGTGASRPGDAAVVTNPLEKAAAGSSRRSLGLRSTKGPPAPPSDAAGTSRRSSSTMSSSAAASGASVSRTSVLSTLEAIDKLQSSHKDPAEMEAAMAKLRQTAKAAQAVFAKRLSSTAQNGKEGADAAASQRQRSPEKQAAEIARLKRIVTAAANDESGHT